MGEIARTAANNITTSGVFTADAITNASVTGITVLANAEDGITLISSQTASNSASISFTSGLDSTYKAYKFVFVNLHPRADIKDLKVNFSTDGGSNYTATTTSTFFGAYHAESDAYAGLEYYAGEDVAQGTNAGIADNTGGDSDEGISGSFILFNPASTTYVKHWICSVNYVESAPACNTSFTAGYVNTTSAVNAIRWNFTSTNIDGTIYLYGIK
jgi:hypothetical protein